MTRREDAAAPAPVRTIRVWDLPVRVCHWLILALVLLAWATAEDEGGWLTVHFVAGYGVLAALIFRLGWGVVGGEHARFRTFVRAWPTVRAYTGRLLRLAPPHYVGHNPLGGWMAVLLLLVLAAVVATGLFAGGEEGTAGPWARLVSPTGAEAMSELHEGLFGVLQVLVAVHIVGVLADSVLTRHNLIRAMWDGAKRLREDETVIGPARDAAGGPAWLGLVVAAAAVALVVLMVR